MLLQDQTIKDFVALTASDAPVPGGGSVSALCAAVSAALVQMVAGLTAGKKGYEAASGKMAEIAAALPAMQKEFLEGIDKDSQAFDKVMGAFRLPKSTDEEKAYRRQKINEATLYAAEVPLGIARKALEMTQMCKFVASNGNKNALSDAAVAAMTLRTAVRGALFNVRINLAGLPEGEYRSKLFAEVEETELQIEHDEKEILESIKF